MKSHFTFLTLIPVLALAACASNPPAAPDAQTASAEQPKVECDRTYRTGSMLAKKDCEPPLTPEERARLQEAMGRVRPSASQTGSGK